MVTCQSANQLKTPAKVCWAFKMVSQFGSLGYTIMGKTADLTVVQKTIIDTLHKEGKPQMFIVIEHGCSQSAVSKHVNRKLSGRKKCGRKRCTTKQENADFIFQQDLAPAHTAKSTKSWLNDHGVGVLDWPANSPDLNPRESIRYCQEENEKQETKKCRWAEGHCQRNLCFCTTSAVPQTDHLHATPNWGSN